MNFELAILNAIQSNLRGEMMDSLMIAVTKLGDKGIVWIVLAVVLLLYGKTRRLGAIVLLSLLLEALCCNVILKPLVDRPRPFAVAPIGELLIAAPSDASFPSGHTGASFACAAALFFAHDRLWIPAGILAALIAFSRLYLYVHFPSDVLGGVLLGIASGYAANRLLALLSKKRA